MSGLAFLLEHAAWERREDMLEFRLSHGMDGAPILHALAYGEDQPDLRLRLIKLCHRFGATVPLETFFLASGCRSPAWATDRYEDSGPR